MKLYQDKEWLYNKYWKENLFQHQIAKLCGVSRMTIYKWLKRLDIPKLYQNKDWLNNKYWVEMLSMPQIAEICGVTRLTIRKWMKRLNIPCRSLGEANHLGRGNHCSLSEEAINFINGELLGDSFVGSQSKYSAYFSYNLKHSEHIKYISKTLDYFGIKQAGKIYKQYCHNCYSYHYASRSYVELLDLRKKWYPNGKKIVPPDLKLTSITCLQWYIGDGSLKKNKNIVLATNGFTVSDVKFLVKKLNELNFKSSRQKCENTIYISPQSTKDFLDYIGKCPVKCYERKWAY